MSYTREQRMAKEALPYKRVGLCCGMKCAQKEKPRMQLALYRVREGEYRYRCRECFYDEVGHWP